VNWSVAGKITFFKHFSCVGVVWGAAISPMCFDVFEHGVGVCEVVWELGWRVRCGSFDVGGGHGFDLELGFALIRIKRIL